MNNKPIIIKETIKKFDHIESDLDGKTIAELIEFFKKWPKDAVFNLDISVYYGEPDTRANIEIKRLENKEEAQYRVERIERMETKEIERKRKLLKALKRELGE